MLILLLKASAYARICSSFSGDVKFHAGMDVYGCTESRGVNCNPRAERKWVEKCFALAHEGHKALFGDICCVDIAALAMHGLECSN